MKILFIFTGGTIGSTQVGDVISADESKSYGIIAAYNGKYPIDFEYDTYEPYTELSENNTGAHLRMLSESVRNNLHKGYDGIIVTHGTDTLQYSAAAVGYAIGLDTIPVCFVSANRPIENPKSNALDNLRGAVRFIECKGGKGAFVIYRNDGEDTVYAHRATRLLAGVAFADTVGSIYGDFYGEFDKDFNFSRNGKYKEAHDEQMPLDFSAIGERSEGIFVFPCYTGMAYPTLSDGIKHVILNTYHSGTVNTKSRAAREFFLGLRDRGVKVFASGVLEGPEYESATEFEELGIIRARSISPVSLYIKLWALSSMGRDAEKEIGLSLSGDICE